MKETKPILAICYDFDKTLSPDDMQSQGFIQSLKCEVADFWQESNKLAEDNEMDQNLAYMYLMSSKARGKVLFTRKTLMEEGKKIRLFDGVSTWFDRINNYGKEHNIEVEHYIISSGLKEMIEGTEIADKFKKIFASSFYYDKDDVAIWPAQVINYTNKTQFLFRIEKGVLDVNSQEVNSHFEQDEFRVQFRNMVYIGDSDTDIPCMKLINVNGGHSIGVYNSETKDKSKVFRMLADNRIKYYVAADYTENSELDILIKSIIDRTETNEKLENKYYACKSEMSIELGNKSEEEQQKEELINSLEDSRNFANTHSIVKKLSRLNNWTQAQREKLINIALSNSQVRYILKDDDIREFYKIIIQEVHGDNAEEIQKIIC